MIIIAFDSFATVPPSEFTLGMHKVSNHICGRLWVADHVGRATALHTEAIDIFVSVAFEIQDWLIHVESVLVHQPRELLCFILDALSDLCLFGNLFHVWCY
jgi:hypothetical protein